MLLWFSNIARRIFPNSSRDDSREQKSHSVVRKRRHSSETSEEDENFPVIYQPPANGSLTNNLTSPRKRARFEDNYLSFDSPLHSQKPSLLCGFPVRSFFGLKAMPSNKTNNLSRSKAASRHRNDDFPFDSPPIALQRTNPHVRNQSYFVPRPHTDRQEEDDLSISSRDEAEKTTSKIGGFLQPTRSMERSKKANSSIVEESSTLNSSYFDKVYPQETRRSNQNHLPAPNRTQIAKSLKDWGYSVDLVQREQYRQVLEQIQSASKAATSPTYLSSSRDNALQSPRGKSPLKYHQLYERSKVHLSSLDEYDEEIAKQHQIAAGCSWMRTSPKNTTTLDWDRNAHHEYPSRLQSPQPRSPDHHPAFRSYNLKSTEDLSESFRNCDIDSVLRKFRSLADEKGGWRKKGEQLEAECGLRRSERLKTQLKHEDEVRLRMRLEGIVVSEAEVEEEEEEFPEFSPEQEKIIQNAFGSGPPMEVLNSLKAEGLEIKRKDIRTLKGLEWLNDEVINFYMQLLRLRSIDENYPKPLPKVYAFNTFFYTKLTTEGYTQQLKRWTRKVDIFSFDILLIPVHLGVHWCLAVIDFRQKRIKYFDSMGGQKQTGLDALMGYLHQESMDKKKVPFDTAGWCWDADNNVKVPQQLNGCDCGVFTCKFADYVSRDKPFTFTQQHMPYFRQRTALELVQGRLMN